MEVPPLGALVELRPGLDKFYDGARSGWRGVVRNQKTDDDGFDMIYIEWEDRETERAQADGWTYPGHFVQVGEKAPTLEGFASDMIDQVDRESEFYDDEDEDEDEDLCPECGSEHTEEERREYYLNLLSEAAEGAAEGEGFALFFVQRRETENGIEITPFMVSTTLSDVAQALIEAQIIKVSEMCVDKFMSDYMRRFL